MRINVDQIEAVCRKYEGCDPSYFVGDIPASKSSGARRSQNISESEPIIALIDFTLFGGASDSLVITDRGIAWKGMAERPKRLPWGDLVKCNIRQERKLGINHILFDDKLSMDLAGTNALDSKGNDTVLQLLKELQILSCSITEQHVVGSEAGSMVLAGLEECEFCGGRIKPEVTFCKYCGIKLRG